MGRNYASGASRGNGGYSLFLQRYYQRKSHRNGEQKLKSQSIIG